MPPRGRMAHDGCYYNRWGDDVGADSADCGGVLFMSKIEKALQRAKGENRLALVPVRRNPESTPGAGTSEPSGGSELSLSRQQSQQDILRMQEAGLRDRHELMQRGIISPELTENATVQAFRELRTRILQQTQGRNGII